MTIWPLSMKRAASTGRVVPMKLPPVAMRPPAATTIPCGLTRYTLPVAETVPAMVDGASPVTRFSVAPVPFSIRTVRPEPTEKLRQSTTPRAVD